MFTLLLMAQLADPLVEAARVRLTGERRCVVDPNSTDVTVCGLRQADRFRVPFVVHDPGDPHRQPAMADRVRLLHRTTPLQDMGPFQVGGGHAGVSLMVSAAGVSGGGLRKPAP
ncbi:hypothetical protein [uncultured Sphingomonas sp.]|uniref:hypothetical protein n=1 Tax=uncultured Sphingomonas sp. TaxID=158754 RepID=UPI0035C95144